MGVKVRKTQSISSNSRTMEITTKVLGEEAIEDQMNRLSDDLVLLILQKHLGSFPDAKFLCIISLVSKRFASLIIETTIVSLQIPNWNPSNDLPHSLISSSNPSPDTSDFLVFENQAKILQPIKFLSKFSSIRSLFIKLVPTSLFSEDYYMVKWKAIFKALKPHSFVILCVKNLITGTIDNEELEIQLTYESIDSKMGIVGYHIRDVNFRYELLKIVVSEIPMIKELVITDSREQGRIALGEDQLFGLGKNSGFDSDGLNMCMKTWFAPLLLLPLSGFVMKDVILLVVKNKESGEEEDFIVKCAFEEEEDTLREAAIEMMKEEPYMRSLW